jgi:hypothetical protein
VDSDAGLDSAWVMGCWMAAGADELCAGILVDEGTGKFAELLFSAVCGCIAMRTRYTPAATMASTTTIATNQPP